MLFAARIPPVQNLIYFAGVREIECMTLLIPREGPPCAVCLWLDAGYVREVSGLDRVHGYHWPSEDAASAIVELIKGLWWKKKLRVGFERYFVDFRTYLALRTALPDAEFVDAAELIYRLRSIKSRQELDLLRQASEAVCAGMKAALGAVRPGVTELEVLAEAQYAMMKAGSEEFPFRAQVVAGPRTLLSHPCASNRTIRPGEVVVIHLGARCGGYCSKICRTVAVGDIPAEQMRVFQALLRAQERAIQALRPGVKAQEVDAAAREALAELGYRPDHLAGASGYGVGLRQSEFYPIISPTSQHLLEAGMTVDLLMSTLYVPGAGPRITDVILITPDGPKMLTEFPRELFG